MQHKGSPNSGAITGCSSWSGRPPTLRCMFHQSPIILHRRIPHIPLLATLALVPHTDPRRVHRSGAGTTTSPGSPCWYMHLWSVCMNAEYRGALVEDQYWCALSAWGLAVCQKCCPCRCITCKHRWRVSPWQRRPMATTTSSLDTDAGCKGHRMTSWRHMFCTHHWLCRGGIYTNSTVVPLPCTCNPPHTCCTVNPVLTCSLTVCAIMANLVGTLAHSFGHYRCTCYILHVYGTPHTSHVPWPSSAMYMSCVFS